MFKFFKKKLDTTRDSKFEHGRLRKIKNAIKAFIDYLAEDNKKNFGEKKLDCCNLKDKD